MTPQKNQLRTSADFNQNIIYVHLSKNPRFGARHNKATEKAFGNAETRAERYFEVFKSILI